MGWEEVLKYVAPIIAAIAYALRVEGLLRHLNEKVDSINGDSGVRELIHYVKWQTKLISGKSPPPYIPD